MTRITTLFWDVGGVVLTNGWDKGARRRAVETFSLDREEFEKRHAQVANDLETGRLTFDDYLNRTVFYEPRPFSPEAFKSFMFSCSEPYPEALAVVAKLARTRKYLIATLNNESLELNRHRIERFGLRSYFDVFLSSCFLGVTKPDAAIYQRALQITQRRPEECVFTDDRAENVESARRCGIHAIHYRDPAQLAQSLARLGVQIET